MAQAREQHPALAYLDLVLHVQPRLPALRARGERQRLARPHRRAVDGLVQVQRGDGARIPIRLGAVARVVQPRDERVLGGAAAPLLLPAGVGREAAHAVVLVVGGAAVAARIGGLHRARVGEEHVGARIEQPQAVAQRGVLVHRVLKERGQAGLLHVLPVEAGLAHEAVAPDCAANRASASGNGWAGMSNRAVCAAACRLATARTAVASRERGWREWGGMDRFPFPATTGERARFLNGFIPITIKRIAASACRISAGGIFCLYFYQRAETRQRPASSHVLTDTAEGRARTKSSACAMRTWPDRRSRAASASSSTGRGR